MGIYCCSTDTRKDVEYNLECVPVPRWPCLAECAVRKRSFSVDLSDSLYRKLYVDSDEESV